MLNWFLATRRKVRELKALHAWRQGALVGLGNRLFPDMPDLVLGPIETARRIESDWNFAQGYGWAMNSAVAVSLPDDQASATAGEGQ